MSGDDPALGSPLVDFGLAVNPQDVPEPPKPNQSILAHTDDFKTPRQQPTRIQRKRTVPPPGLSGSSAGKDERPRRAPFVVPVGFVSRPVPAAGRHSDLDPRPKLSPGGGIDRRRKAEKRPRTPRGLLAGAGKAAKARCPSPRAGPSPPSGPAGGEARSGSGGSQSAVPERRVTAALRFSGADEEGSLAGAATTRSITPPARAVASDAALPSPVPCAQVPGPAPPPRARTPSLPAVDSDLGSPMSLPDLSAARKGMSAAELRTLDSTTPKSGFLQAPQSAPRSMRSARSAAQGASERDAQELFDDAGFGDCETVGPRSTPRRGHRAGRHSTPHMRRTVHFHSKDEEAQWDRDAAMWAAAFKSYIDQVDQVEL
eukprot:TRINITY_DN50199_c0_g1_i1.p2 TRINITY_DN50199_c0_g1~~TRINITY_DN50199_c0_g1_i1.p2  ORF type:complete len:372 (+),score=58.72 TRINITY_DN50199_c0_g1_i1:93-1208(+)